MPVISPLNRRHFRRKRNGVRAHGELPLLGGGRCGPSGDGQDPDIDRGMTAVDIDDIT